MVANELKSKIEEITDNSSIHLLEALSKDAGFFTSDKKLIYMSLNNFSYKAESIDTEYLSLQLNVPIHAVDNSPTFNDGFYNIIIYKGSLDDNNINSFIKLCSIHASHENELAFRDFFYALISLFQLPKDQAYKNAVGLYGELKYMQHAAEEYNVDISPFWHRRGSMSKLDFSNKVCGIEIKTTSSENSTVRIKHEQIFGNFNCYLVAVECEQSDVGESLHDVIVSMQNSGTKFKNLNFAINLEKELNRIYPQQIKDLLLRVEQISVFSTSSINPFPALPDSVSELHYDLDITESNSLSSNYEKELLSEFVNEGDIS